MRFRNIWVRENLAPLQGQKPAGTPWLVRTRALTDNPLIRQEGFPVSDQNQEKPGRGTGESRLAPPPPIPGTPPLTTGQEQALRAPPSVPGTARSSTNVRPQERAIPSPAMPQTPTPAAAPPPGLASPAVPGPPPPAAHGGERKLPAAPGVFPQAAPSAPRGGLPPARVGQVGAFGPLPPAPAQPVPGPGYGASVYGPVPAVPATKPSAGVWPAAALYVVTVTFSTGS